MARDDKYIEVDGDTNKAFKAKVMTKKEREALQKVRDRIKDDEKTDQG